MTHSALAVGLDRRTMNQFLSRAGTRKLDVECATQALQALTMATHHKYELVACAYPLPDMVLRKFCDALRNRDSASRDAALLVLSLPDMQSEAQRALPSGRTLVRSRHGSEPVLNEAIVHLLRVAPRRPIDLPIEISPADDPRADPTQGRLVNISKSGMLIANPTRPEIGHRCRFGIFAEPSEAPISGIAEVVRHTVQGHEAVVGFAAKFITALPGSEDRFLGLFAPGVRDA